MHERSITAHEIVVGIDAGGSATRARGISDGRVVHDGTGGPGNPLATAPDMLRSSYASALEGCPAPGRITACVAGAESHEMRVRIHDLLAELAPAAVVTVLPDYAAAVAAAPDGTHVVVIAGTGSLVCSRDASGIYAISGGRGWILGDHGSAARLGRAALEWYCEDPDAARSEFAPVVEGAFGSCDWRRLVKAISSAPSPAAMLARAAPLLTEAASRGNSWAVSSLNAEMRGLAVTTSRHIERHLATRGMVRIALAGGVWASQVAQRSFSDALAQVGVVPAVVASSAMSPLDGAVRLALGGYP